MPLLLVDRERESSRRSRSHCTQDPLNRSGISTNVARRGSQSCWKRKRATSPAAFDREFKRLHDAKPVLRRDIEWHTGNNCVAHVLVVTTVVAGIGRNPGLGDRFAFCQRQSAPILLWLLAPIGLVRRLAAFERFLLRIGTVLHKRSTRPVQSKAWSGNT